MTLVSLTCVFTTAVAEPPADDPSQPNLETVAGLPPELIAKLSQVKGFADVDQIAKTLADAPMHPRATAPDELTQLSYDDYMKIQFLHGRAIWDRTGSPFLIETFHQGYVQRDRVLLFNQVQQTNHFVPFSPHDFGYDGIEVSGQAIANAGHAGFKVVGKFDADGADEEILTFLGSSYFRARSGDTVYGTSVRGLAVDVALPKDEEFPFYRAFWLLKPKDENDESVTVLALMDSPSVAGAYRFVLTPGPSDTTVAVTASVHCRTDVEKLALAPITSMWMWGDGQTPPSLETRPRVHDSQGLYIAQANQPPLYRPFARIQYPSVSRFAVEELEGFGLVQRVRDPGQYRDANARYEDRPSVWVRPTEAWSGGVIELLEIPGAHEGVDNIGAYWIPNRVASEGSQFELAYDVHFTSQSASKTLGEGSTTDDPTLGGDEAVLRSLEVHRPDDEIEIVATFAGETLQGLEGLSIEARTVRASILEKAVLEQLIDESVADRPSERTVRLRLRPENEMPVEVTFALKQGERTVGESIAYLCPPRHPRFVFPAVYTKQE